MRVENYSDKYLQDVMRLVESFHKEAVGEYEGAFDPNTLIETIKREREVNSGNCFLMIVEKDGQDSCEGILFGVRFKSPISTQVIFQEMIWYVSQEFRSRGVKLLGEVEKVLQFQGVGSIIMAVLHNSKTEKLKSLYEKMGYQAIETHYLRKL